MKKYIIFIFGSLVVGMISCKKSDNVSHEVTVSAPTITITGSQFYSIPVGGTPPTLSATAYDSVLKESYPVDFDQTSLDNNTAGLYVLQATAKNKNGYKSNSVVYVAVTNVSTSSNLAGKYLRAATGSIANVTKKANGLYATDDLFGSLTTKATAYFVHIDDTTIQMPEQPTALGDLITGSNSLHMAPGDTTYKYALLSLTSNGAVRTFVKQ